MLVLVQNSDETFSFDDITYAIFNRGTAKSKEYFNYNAQMAKQNHQIDIEGLDTDLLRFIISGSGDTPGDELIRRKYAKSNEPGFLKLPTDLIKPYSEKTKETTTISDSVQENIERC